MISESVLSAYIDGTLDAEQLADVERALESSPELRAEVDRLLSVDRALTNYGVTVMASTASFRSEVYQNVSSTYVTPAATGLSGGMVATIAAITSAVVAGGLWYIVGTTSPAPAPVSQVDPVSPSTVVTVDATDAPTIETPLSASKPSSRSRSIRRNLVAPTEPYGKDAPPYSNKTSEEILRESKLASDLKKLDSKIAAAERNGDHALVSSLARKAAITAGKLGDRNMRTTMWERAIRAAELAGDEARANQYRWEQEVSAEE